MQSGVPKTQAECIISMGRFPAHVPGGGGRRDVRSGSRRTYLGYREMSALPPNALVGFVIVPKASPSTPSRALPPCALLKVQSGRDDEAPALFWPVRLNGEVSPTVAGRVYATV